jgi:AraC-like DNA-binding protein
MLQTNAMNWMKMGKIVRVFRMELVSKKLHQENPHLSRRFRHLTGQTANIHRVQ